jgi:hypothetical protein
MNYDLLSYGHVLICRNGHVINSKKDNDKIPDKYCAQCGDEVINKCPDCGEFFKGTPRTEDVIEGGYSYFANAYVRPAYCVKCGNPFSWTRRAEESAYELIDLAASLNEQEKMEWKHTIPVLINDTPKANVAAIKFKMFAVKAGNEIGKAVRDIVIDVASEIVKKTIIP